MSRVVLVLLCLLTALLSFGLTGQYGTGAGGSVDFSIIVIWLLSWLGDKKVALSFAVILGLMFDFISFIYFGYWLAVFVLVVVFIDWLKINFLTESSFTQALVVLVVVSLLIHLLTSLVLSNFNYVELLLSTLFNALVGAVLYYLFVIRLKMFQRWMGRRL